MAQIPVPIRTGGQRAFQGRVLLVYYGRAVYQCLYPILAEDLGRWVKGEDFPQKRDGKYD